MLQAMLKFSWTNKITNKNVLNEKNKAIFIYYSLIYDKRIYFVENIAKQKLAYAAYVLSGSIGSIVLLVVKGNFEERNEEVDLEGHE